MNTTATEHKPCPCWRLPAANHDYAPGVPLPCGHDPLPATVREVTQQ